jgi:hypothetical protein
MDSTMQDFQAPSDRREMKAKCVRREMSRPEGIGASSNIRSDGLHGS